MDNAEIILETMYPTSKVSFNDLIYPRDKNQRIAFVNIKSDHDFLLQAIWSSTCPFTEKLQAKSFENLKSYQS